MVPGSLPADELKFMIDGVGEPELSNVRNRVEPFQLTRSSRFSKRSLDNVRHKSEQRAREALRPYGYYHVTVNSEIRKSADGGWVLELHIMPGPPLVIRELNLELRGDGSKLKELQEVAGRMASGRWKKADPAPVGENKSRRHWI